MTKTPLLETLTDLASQALTGTDLFLVDIEIKGSDQNPQVGIFVDTEQGGVNIDQCAEINRKLGFLTESHELFTGKFTLNVSSPGLDRPLKDRRQFPKNVGRKAAVKARQPEGLKKIKGVFSSLNDNGITIDTDKKSQLEISWEDLDEIKILPAF